MLKVEITSNHPAWKRLGAMRFIKNVCRIAWETQNKFTAENSEISILLTNDNFIQKLNAKYRKMDKPTNVLSFPMDDDVMRGDIIISYETIKKEAELENKNIKDHLALMVTHGTLHLAGYDHIKDEEAEEMEAMERKILSTIKRKRQ